MYLVSRKSQFEIILHNKTIHIVDEKKKYYIDDEFLSILNFIESKGLIISVPAIIDPWDASFVFRQLEKHKDTLPKIASDLMLFIYMRLDAKTEPLKVEHKGLFAVQ